jgi:hypothetical protein
MRQPARVEAIGFRFGAMRADQACHRSSTPHPHSRRWSRKPRDPSPYGGVNRLSAP